MQNSEIKFDERIKKEIKLINYVNRMKSIAYDLFQ
jgi:hypothetical protein